MFFAKTNFRRGALGIMTAALLVATMGCSDTADENTDTSEDTAKDTPTLNIPLDLSVSANLNDLCTAPRYTTARRSRSRAASSKSNRPKQPRDAPMGGLTSAAAIWSG